MPVLKKWNKFSSGRNSSSSTPVSSPRSTEGSQADTDCSSVTPPTHILAPTSRPTRLGPTPQISTLSSHKLRPYSQSLKKAEPLVNESSPHRKLIAVIKQSRSTWNKPHVQASTVPTTQRSVDYPKTIVVPEETIPATMDFSGFRDTGELSDTTVLVDGAEFKLHKFPLYIKSDFFRALARNPPKETIELTDFPGGAMAFEMVANYCYNIKITITKENVCALRCAAEFLQMNSRANLADVADRFLQDTLTSAKLSHHMGCIINLVLQSCELGAIAEQAGVVDKCLCAIVDCWLLSTKFTKRIPAERGITTLTDKEVFEQICKFPVEWFTQLVARARDKSVRPQVLVQLVQTYINTAVKKTNGTDLLNETKPSSTSQEEEEEVKDNDDDGDEKSTEEAEAEDVPETDDVKEAKNEENAKAEKEEDESEEKESTGSDHSNSGQDSEGTPVDPEEKPEAVTEANPQEKSEEPQEDVADEEPVDIKQVLDSIIPQLPDTLVVADLLQPHWTIKVLNLAEELECECCAQLRRLVGRMLHRFSPQELSDMPPGVLTDIVQEACQDPQPGQHSLVCGVIDNYLREMSQKGELNIDTFTTMVQAVPADYRMSHDTLFQVLEALLQSDKVKLTDEQKASLMDTVDFGRLSEATLKRAYDSDLVPQAYITKAALALCSRLRTELESARAVIKSQEDEMSRYGLGGRTQPSYYTRHVEPSHAPSVVSSSSKLRYDAPGITYTYPSGAMSSLSSDLELQLALDSIETRQAAAAASQNRSSTYPSYASSIGDSYYDDPLDSDAYRSKSYYRGTQNRFNYRY